MRLARASKWFAPIEITNDVRASMLRHNQAYREHMASKSHRLLLEMGFIDAAPGKGLYHLLPMCQRVLDKLLRVVDDEFQAIGCQKLSLPTLIRKDLLTKSGRWELTERELFKLTDREKHENCLAPTHEEVVTGLFSPHGPYANIGERRLPLYLYQVTPKFRAELNPRFGLLRTREFLMKDLYTFDASLESAKETFSIVQKTYEKLLHRLWLPIHRTEAATGNIGGSSAVEYHVPSAVGQDTVFLCSSCIYGFNKELLMDNLQEAPKCPTCGTDLKEKKSIEVGHLFLLGQRYSEIFNACYHVSGGGKKLLQMGCYGIGITRLLATIVEHLALPTQLRFPTEIAPFRLCIIGPKKGSREARSSKHDWDELLGRTFAKKDLLGDEVIIDDRTNRSVGYRLADAKRLGIPFVVIANKSALHDPPEFEVIDVYADETTVVDHVGLLDYFQTRVRDVELARSYA